MKLYHTWRDGFWQSLLKIDAIRRRQLYLGIQYDNSTIEQDYVHKNLLNMKIWYINELGLAAMKKSSTEHCVMFINMFKHQWNKGLEIFESVYVKIGRFQYKRSFIVADLTMIIKSR